jgi:hypothetical protein
VRWWRLTRTTVAVVAAAAALAGAVTPAAAQDAEQGRVSRPVGAGARGTVPSLETACQQLKAELDTLASPWAKLAYSSTPAWSSTPGAVDLGTCRRAGFLGVSAPTNHLDAALAWMSRWIGSAAYNGYCERAVELAFGTEGIYPSAFDHWLDAYRSGRAHPGDLDPPRGAIVFWAVAMPLGHVGISLGDGRFVSTSVRGGIGVAELSYFPAYLGWADPPPSFLRSAQR